MQKFRNLFATALLSLSLVNIAIQYFSGFANQRDLINSDALYLPTLFADILSMGGHIRDWFLTPSPYFFPDYPIFWIAYATGTQPFTQILIFSLLQTSLLFIALWFLAKQIGNFQPIFTAACITTILVWLALAGGQPFNLLLNSAYHYGIFIIAIFFVAVWLRHADDGATQIKPAVLVIAAFLAFASTLSDNLFIVQFVAPLVLTVLFTTVAKRRLPQTSQFALVLTTIIFSLLGMISYKFFVTHLTRYPAQLGLAHLSANVEAIGQLLIEATWHNPAYGVIFVVYLGIAVYSAACLLRRSEADSRAYRLAVFTLASFCITLATLSLATVVPVNSRYMTSILSWPVIIVFMFFSNYSPLRFSAAAALVTLLGTFSMTHTSYVLAKQNGTSTDYYPADIACIDAVLQTEHLSSGIAQYWDAKFLQNFSKVHPNLAQHMDNMDQMPWITSKQYFHKRYDFAIVSEDSGPPYKFSATTLAELNGAPRLIKSCGNRSVYVYGKDKLAVTQSSDVGSTVTWKACTLPTQIGKQDSDCKTSKKDNAVPGYLTFGPYKKLPAGTYRVIITYKSSPRRTESVGEWDVGLALPTENKNLIKGALSGTDGTIGTITGEFSISPEQESTPIEIRTFSHAATDLELSSIAVRRIR